MRSDRLFRHGWWKILVEACAVIAVICAVLEVVETVRFRSVRRQIEADGFPRSYADRLAALKVDYPNWRFVALPVSDITWAEAVDKECSPGWNLVAYSSWAPSVWKHLGTQNYIPYYAEHAKAYDSGAWYQASREAIGYFMDPRNFLNENEIFMFETLEYDESYQTREAVERALASTFMASAKCDGGGESFSDLIIRVGRELGVSPVFLAGRLASEQGNGSVQASGKIGDSLVDLYTNRQTHVGSSVVWGRNFSRDGTNTAAVVAAGASTYNGCYNFFNIGAYGSGIFEIRYNAWREAVSRETCSRYCGPWTSQRRAIEGGARKIKERYVDSRRHTRYLQKFSVAKEAGAFRWQQYMQNIAAPLVEARMTAAAYCEADVLDAPYRFVIPVFAKMPEEPSPDPAKGKSVYSPTR